MSASASELKIKIKCLHYQRMGWIKCAVTKRKEGECCMKTCSNLSSLLFSLLHLLTKV